MLRIAALIPRHNASRVEWSEFMEFNEFRRTEEKQM